MPRTASELLSGMLRLVASLGTICGSGRCALTVQVMLCFGFVSLLQPFLVPSLENFGMFGILPRV